MAPSRDEQNALHAAVARGDSTASAKVVQLLIGPLIERLQYKWPRTDTRDLEEQAADSLLNYLRAPQRYNPERASLLHYLVLDAHRDLINAYNKPRRLEEIPNEGVALSPVPRNNETDEFVAFSDEAGDQRIEALLDEAFPNEADRSVVELIRNGVRRNAPYAAALGFSHLPIEEQNQEVKRVKDRIKKKLRRLVAHQL
jgi:hypothetical protein